MPDMSKLEINGVVYDVRDPTKAPAGYGLGVFPDWKTINDESELNNILNNGWYTIDCSGKLHVGTNIFQHFTLFVSTYNGDHTWQDAYICGSTYHLTRSKMDKVWGEWEWVNPPMLLGVEYRTTERWLGSPVYTKCIAFGELPSNTAKSVNHNASGKVFLGVRFIMSNNTPLTVGDGASKIGVSTTAVYVTTTTTFNSTATAQIWYTKE